MRRFGVEIEHKQPKFVCGTGCSISKGGHYSCQLGGFKPEWEKKYPQGWGNLHVDGSGIEISSPILEGDDGLTELKNVMEFLRELGGRVFDSDGLHVHHDAPELLVEDDDVARKRIVTLAQSWCNNQAIINELVLPHRRDDWFKCSMAGYSPTSCYKQVTQQYVDRVTKAVSPRPEHEHPGWRKVKPYAACGDLLTDRMYALNISALARTGTVEIRQYQGTLDFDRARAWIRFGQRFIDTSLQDDTPIAPYSNIDSLMRDIGLDSFERGILSEVAR